MSVTHAELKLGDSKVSSKSLDLSVPKFASNTDEVWQIHSLPGKCIYSEEEELLVERICGV